MNQCPFFNICGGCKFNFLSPDYRLKKQKLLDGWRFTESAVWSEPFSRRRADFCFSNGEFGFFKNKSKDIVQITKCPLLVDEINQILPIISKFPWCGSGAALVTSCDNGLDMAITSDVPYFSKEFKQAVDNSIFIRVTWNGKIVKQIAIPQITFGNKTVEYVSGAFLQPTKYSEDYIRKIVVDNAESGGRIADLFCGLGNFTYALNADGFDVFGIGAHRDLFKKPLTAKQLEKYNCVVMDPPRAGAIEQCRELIKSNVKKIIYVSCNPNTFKRDMNLLCGGQYNLIKLIPVDQFLGSEHWELIGVFQK